MLMTFIMGLLDSTAPSLASDFFSISSSSEDIDQHTQGSPGFLFFKQLLRHYLNWRAKSEAQDGHDANNPMPTRSAPTESGDRDESSPFSKTRTQGIHRKRDYETSSGDDGENQEPPKRPKIQGCKDQPKKLPIACPFWKFDSRKHRKCYLKALRDIRDLKVHFARRHTPAIFCSRCYVIFKTRDELGQHGDQHCMNRSPTEFEGILPEKALLLNKRKVRGVSDKDEWYRLWGILFPGAPRPASIYMDATASEDFGFFQEFIQQEGLTFFLETLQRSGILLRQGVSQTQLRETVRGGLQAMIGRFQMGQTQGAAGHHDAQMLSDSDREEGILLTQQQTVPGSNVDSGLPQTSTTLSTASRSDLRFLQPIAGPSRQYGSQERRAEDNLENPVVGAETTEANLNGSEGGGPGVLFGASNLSDVVGHTPEEPNFNEFLWDITNAEGLSPLLEHLEHYNR